MKFTTVVAAIAAILPLHVSSIGTSIYSYPMLSPVSVPFTSFESDIEVTEGYAPSHTYWCTNGFNRGYMGIQTASPTDRRVLFSLWNKDADNLAQVIELGKGVLNATFGHEGTGVHAWLPYNWKTGEKMRLRVDAEFSGNDTIYSGYFWLDKKWFLIAKILGPDYGNEGLGYHYQFLENFGHDTTQTRRGVYSGQCYRQLGNKSCFPALGTTFTYTQLEDTFFGAGLNTKRNGLYLAIDGEGFGPNYNFPASYTKYYYDIPNIIWQAN
ncbi:hypothetical protein K7432_010347 [Basidiobolus ranarum]|uniref:DUF5077 domain-containing protein n=1 Tax=Basidiobolus ranarum TaxID=34480 RepID=A0ABR2VW07_9FUNG